MKLRFLLGAAIAAVLPFFGHAEFAYSFTATINYQGAETLVDFPVLVRLPMSVSSRMRGDGRDIRFYLEDGTTELAHECESFDPIDGALCWVKVPSLSSGTKLVVRFCDPDFDTEPDAAAVWSSYIGVWHLDDVMKACVDSTGGTGNAVVDSGRCSSVGGKLVTACRMIGTTDWTAPNIGRVTVNNKGSLATDGKLTATWWMKPNSSGAMPRTMDKASYLLQMKEGTKGYILWDVRYQMGVDAVPSFNLRSYKEKSAGAQSVSVDDADTKLNLPGWLHLACTIEDDAEHASATGAIWADAVLQEQGELNPLLSAGEGGQLLIGNSGGGDNYKGQMDEFRLRSVVSSADWIKAERDSVDKPEFVKLPDDLDKLFTVTRRVVATAAEKEGDWADATVAGDDAYAAIQGVIDASSNNDTILVKAGTYLLTNELVFASDALTGVTFRSDDGEGGLARKATLLVGGYPATTNRLVRIETPDVTVDGFTLTNGFVNAAPGGGAYLDDCGAGGGLRNCDIVGCTAWNETYKTKAVGFPNGTGGGAYVKTTGCISNCLFKSNVSFAGAVSLVGTKSAITPPKDAPWVTRCEFIWNEQVGLGNANNCNGSAVATQKACCIDHCSIVSNFCNVTGGMQISTVGSYTGYLTISNCVFRANGLGKSKVKLIGTNSSSTIRCVGNAFVEEVANPILSHLDGCGSYGNSMINCAGILGSTSVKNCFFYGNTNANGCVSGICRAENCTFVNNLGAIYSDSSKEAVGSRTNVAVNCLFVGNVNDVFAFSEGNSTRIALILSNCCIRALSLDRAVGTNRKFGILVTNDCNIIYGDGDWAKVSETVVRFRDPGRGDFRLREGSQLVGAGMTLGWMDGASDADGNPRVVGAAPDIGCYERQEGDVDPTPLCVRAVATEEDKTDVWKDAFVGLEAAVAAAGVDTPVYAKAGTYGVTDPIAMRSWGARIIGEGAGATIVDGGSPEREGRIFTIDALNVTLEGLTLRNGKVVNANGGGVLVNAIGFAMRNCVVDSCSAKNGGGLYAESKCPCLGIVDTVFQNCRADASGACAYFADEAGLAGCTFRDSTGATSGGGIYCNGAFAVADCVFTNCATSASGSNQRGGALYGYSKPGEIARTQFLDCAAKNDGSVCYFNAHCEITDCLFANSCDTHPEMGGGVIGSGNSSSHTLVRCTFRNNAVNGPLVGGLGGDSVVTNCVIEGNRQNDGKYPAVVSRAGSGNKPQVVDCLIRDTYADRILASNVELVGCVCSNITLRTAFCENGTATVRNCLITGCAEPVKIRDGLFENCSLVGNEGGVVLDGNYSPRFTNCVFWANKVPTKDYYGSMGFYVKKDDFAATNRVKMANCVLQANEEADARVPDMRDADKTGKTTELTEVAVRRGPKFVDPANGDWHLKSSSPLRDKGLVLDWMTDEAVDLDGKPRRISSDGKAYPDSLPDIGCYECDIPKPGLMLYVR